MNAHFRFVASLAVLSATSLASTGCEWVMLAAALADDDSCDGDPCCGDPCCGDPCCGDPCCDGGCENEAVPPDVSIVIADWPPIGPEGTVEVQAFSDSGLAEVRFFFQNDVTVPIENATSATIRATGEELGAGQGTLGIEVSGNDAALTRRAVDGLLVDLGAPTAYFTDTVLAAAGQNLSFWIADDWVVSGYELLAGSDGQWSSELEPGYPSTVGVEWDYSLVSIPVEELPVGTHVGSLRVWDAAGNETTLDLPFTIDGVPPSIDITEPADGATVSASFQVTALATDDSPFAVGIAIYVGGALVGTGVAPSATLTLDAAEFPEGTLDVTAVAVDKAGNESAIASRSITIAKEAEGD